MDPQLVILGIEAIQRIEYPDHEEWFYEHQTVDNLIEILEIMIEEGSEL